MKCLFCVLGSFLLFQGCGSVPAPAWQESGHIHLNNFIDSYMAGELAVAAVNYRLLMENLQKTGDPDIIIRGPLTRCAMDRALLRDAPCEDAWKYLGLLEEEENRRYFEFVAGNRAGLDDIPEKYAAIYLQSRRCNLSKAKKAISKQETPLSFLLATEISLSNGCYDDGILENAVDMASSQGWTLAVRIYLTRLQAYYEESDRSDVAARVRERIRMIETAAPPK